MTNSHSADRRLTALSVEMGKLLISVLALVLVGIAIGSVIPTLHQAVSSLNMSPYVVLGAGIGSLWLAAIMPFLLLLYAYGERQDQRSI